MEQTQKPDQQQQGYYHTDENTGEQRCEHLTGDGDKHKCKREKGKQHQKNAVDDVAYPLFSGMGREMCIHVIFNPLCIYGGYSVYKLGLFSSL